MLGRQSLQSGADGGVGSDSASDDERGRTVRRPQRLGRPVDQAVHHRRLERGGDVFGRILADDTRHRAFQPGEREMRFGRAFQRARQRDSLGIPQCRGPFDGGTAGEAQAKQLGGLVERLARRVVDRRGKAAIGSNPLDQQQLAMSARYEQQQIGKFEVGVRQPRR